MQISKYASRGRNHTRFLSGLLSPIWLLAVGLLGLTGCERYALDQQMEELCKKDGGIKIYETVTLPASEFTSTGAPLGKYIPLANSESDYLGPDYRYVQKREILVGPRADATKGEGQLIRVYQAVYRQSDGRLLGENVWYSRSGGDGFTLGFQPSGRSCPRLEQGLFRSIFLRGN